MKDPNGFDELARRKLAEREFAFDRSHWTDMERLLTERDRKPGAWWPWMAAGVLLLGGATLWSTLGDDAVPGGTGAVAVAEQPEKLDPSTGPGAAVATTTPVQAASAATAHIQTDPAPVSMSTAPATDHAHKGTRARSDAMRTRAVSSSKADAGMTASAPGTAGSIDPHPAVTVSTTPTAHTLTNEATAAEPAQETFPMTVNTGSSAASSDQFTAASEAPKSTLAIVAEPGETTTTRNQPMASEVVQPPPTSTDPQVSEPSHAEHEAEASDTEAPTALAAEPSTMPPSPPAWLAVRTPVELSALGGVFFTDATYGGDGTETWGASTERLNAAGSGIEGVWNIGAHFGLGTGAFLSSYRERLRTAGYDRTDQELTNSYFWVPYDTMVLTVTGTDTIGAVIYNITELVPTTVYDLGHTTDTSYHTTVLRAPRTVTNTVRYVEVPLLLDAHTSCGRWVFGARGGPTLGLLAGRQTTVPGDGGAGYTDLEQSAFRSLTFGCMARAYVRYRLSSAWSIGLEPTWREQLGNTLRDADIQRRGHAFGGYLSLSYRLTPRNAAP